MKLLVKLDYIPTEHCRGITSFDNGSFTLDGGTTTIDESYSFAVRAQDRFGFSPRGKNIYNWCAKDNNIRIYRFVCTSFLKQSQRELFKDFISNPKYF